jgi:pyruvate kinase
VTKGLLKKTKIVCTVGPASLEAETLERMFQAGMNCVRINTAYGDLDLYKQVVDRVREVADIPVMVDLKGPEIRLRTDKERTVMKGEVLEAGFNGEAISFNHNFIDQMNVGDVVLIDNGRIRTVVTEKADASLHLLVEEGAGVVADGKGVNIPKKQLMVPTLSPWDLKVIEKSRKSKFWRSHSQETQKT